jgi:steroid 5-alpha reductase family enzyme
VSDQVVADEQKRRFARHPENKNKFIDVGLWSVSRHPNYLGEIICWVGLTTLCLSAFDKSERPRLGRLVESLMGSCHS